MRETSEILAAGFDLAAAFERIADGAVPAMFDAISIQGWARHIDPVLVRRGSLSETTEQSHEMLAGGRSVGTLRVGKRSDAVFDDVDRNVMADLASRLALELDRAALYAQEHHVASTLQRALLPERLPEGGGIAKSAAYLPGTSEAAIGGDWYDVFTLADGRTAFSVGDVTGHGLQAAVVMGEVRQAVRAAAVNPKACNLVLQRANMIVNMRPEGLMVTALFGIYDPELRAVTYATAGHPPPVLALDDGSTYVLPGAGIPLGIGAEIDSRDWTFTLPAGAMFVVYTDGLIEHSRDPIAGEAELLAAIRSQTLSANGSPARSIIERIFTNRRNVDDVAVLVLIGRGGTASKSFSFDFSAVPIGVPIVRHALARYAECQDIPGDQRFDILTAVGEAVANAVEHAYRSEDPGVVHVRAESNTSHLVVTVNDSGNWKPSNRRDDRGRGLQIMRALAERVEVRAERHETTVRLAIKR